MDAKWYVTKDFFITGQFNVDIKTNQYDRYTSPEDATYLGETDPAKRGEYRLGTGKAINYDGKIVSTTAAISTTAARASWSMPAPTSSTPIRPRRTPRR